MTGPWREMVSKATETINEDVQITSIISLVLQMPNIFFKYLNEISLISWFYDLSKRILVTCNVLEYNKAFSLTSFK